MINGDLLSLELYLKQAQNHDISTLFNIKNNTHDFLHRRHNWGEHDITKILLFHARNNSL